MATTKGTRTTKSSKAAKPQSGRATARITTQAVDLQEVFRSRAYEMYQERGGEHGLAHEDWLRAEAEVMDRFRQSA